MHLGRVILNKKNGSQVQAFWEVFVLKTEKQKDAMPVLGVNDSEVIPCMDSCLDFNHNRFVGLR